MDVQNKILNNIISITESRDIEILEMSLLRTIFEVIQCPKVFFIKTSPEDKHIRSISGYGPNGYSDLCEMDFCPDIDTLAKSLKKALDDNKAASIQGDNHPFSVTPINVMESQIGFIALDVPDISPADFQILKSLIRIYQNYVAVLLDSQRDTLTGLLNRKTFDDRIMKLIELRKSQKREVCAAGAERRSEEFNRFWLGIFDIDDFKKVNDTFGHIYGDEILILISRIMRYVFRAHDMKFRFGGEEFIVVMKAESAEVAYSVFDRFRKEVEGYAFPQTGKITVSVGIVEITGEESPSVFVGCADSALYYAKHHGKNMTCVYADLVEKKLVKPEAVRKGKVVLFDE